MKRDPHALASVPQQPLVIQRDGQTYVLTRLDAQPWQPASPQRQPVPLHQPGTDVVSLTLAIASIGVVGALLVGGICYSVGYTAGERSNARVLVCQNSSEQFLFWSANTSTCR